MLSFIYNSSNKTPLGFLKKNIKRSIYILLIISICVIPLINQAGIANADAANPDLDEKAKSKLYWSFFEKACANYSSSVDNEDAKNYNFFEASSGRSNVGYLGQYLNKSDKLKCTDVGDWFTPAREMWGINTPYSDFLTQIGYHQVGTNWSKGGTDNNFTVQKLKGMIPSKFFEDDNAINYQIVSSTFDKVCKPTFRDNSQNNEDNVKNKVDRWYKIWTFENGQAVQKIVETELEGGDRTELGAGTGVDTNGQASCRDMADALSEHKDWAEAFAAYKAAHPDEKIPQQCPLGDTGPGCDSSDRAEKDSGCSQALTPFGWILCPIANVADNVLAWYESIIKQILYINPDVFANGSGLQQVWRIFSNLASALIVLIALTMVAGQIFNFEIFSAYTVKKVLPRLIIGAILIQLSWFLCATLIQLVNAIGSGLYWLILAPLNFGDTGTGNNFIEFTQVINYGSTENQGGGGSMLANGLGLVGGVVAAGAILYGAWMVVLLGAIGVLISLFVGIVTLMIRAMLIIILIVLAPLAIAAWILPGTQNFWNMWWKMFSRLLMMFPLIMLLFAGGTLAGAIMASTDFGGGTGVLRNFAILVAYFAPIFMISMTYKFAGGAFASIATMGDKLGKKASGSGMFGLRDQAKLRKETSRSALSKKNREADYTRDRQAKYTKGLTETGLRGWALRKRSSNSAEGRQRIADAARNEQFEAGMKDAKNAFELTDLSHMNAPTAAKEMMKLIDTPQGQKATIAGKEITSTTHTRREALDRIAASGQATQLLKAQQSAPTGSPLAGEVQSTLNKHYSTLKPKAPDLYAPKFSDGEHGRPLSTIEQDRAATLRSSGAQDMASWDQTTWRRWGAQFVGASDSEQYTMMQQAEAYRTNPNTNQKIDANIGEQLHAVDGQ